MNIVMARNFEVRSDRLNVVERR